eukprot:47466_1
MMSIIFSMILTALCECHRNDYSERALQDKITTLPGLDPKILQNYTMFSGYIDVYPAHNRSIFYWFVESLNDPKTDPVAFWTNGGPGSSGLIGMFSEQGPFYPFENLTLYVNPYSWVNIANMIFVEIPCGVGFSFSDDPNDYNTSDNQTAVDNYNFVLGWLKVFSNFQSNRFYITAESYGGHFMPTLAQQIILGNGAGGNPQINFKGIFVGNPHTTQPEKQMGNFDTLFGHQMVSLPVWQQYVTACKYGNNSDQACSQAKNAMYNDVGNNIDAYSLDYPVCHQQSRYSQIYLHYKNCVTNKFNIPLLYRDMIEYFDKYPDKDYYEIPVTHPSYRNVNLNIFPPPTTTYYDPCTWNYLDIYLNQSSVQAAIHVAPQKWPQSLINYDHDSLVQSMIPTWKWIIENAKPPLHLTIVSGDDDTVDGTLGTQTWIWNLGYTPVKGK